MKTGSELFSPLMNKYQKILQKNPSSRVFAPLAEIYRKYAMLDKALSTLKDGIRYNPNYSLGYLGLAQCYWDQKQYTLCYSTLRPLVGSNRENVRLQRLFATVCEELNYLEEALATYKHLLYFNPKDKGVGKIVTVLEEKVAGENKEAFFLRDKKLFDSYKLSASPKEMDSLGEEWEQVDLKEGPFPESPKGEEGNHKLMKLYDQKFGPTTENAQKSKTSSSPPPTQPSPSQEELAIAGELEAIKAELWAFSNALRERRLSPQEN